MLSWQVRDKMFQILQLAGLKCCGKGKITLRTHLLNLKQKRIQCNFSCERNCLHSKPDSSSICLFLTCQNDILHNDQMRFISKFRCRSIFHSLTYTWICYISVARTLERDFNIKNNGSLRFFFISAGPCDLSTTPRVRLWDILSPLYPGGAFVFTDTDSL